MPAQVYSCAPKGNPNYTFRESIPLGVTSISMPQFRRSIEGLQDEWQGWTYDLLSRNCNHFCEALVEILGVGPLPGAPAVPAPLHACAGTPPVPASGARPPARR